MLGWAGELVACLPQPEAALTTEHPQQLTRLGAGASEEGDVRVQPPALAWEAVPFMRRLLGTVQVD